MIAEQTLIARDINDDLDRIMKVAIPHRVPALDIPLDQVERRQEGSLFFFVRLKWYSHTSTLRLPSLFLNRENH